MTYTVKEIYETIQGEGYHSGRPAVFLRFAGCNMWSGREEDRGKGPGGCSEWCDTDFVGGQRFSSAEELADEVLGVSRNTRFVVCTGGEPLLQLGEPLVQALKRRDFEVAVETNGTIELPDGIDWVCVSPKPGLEIILRSGDELKLVYPQEWVDPNAFMGELWDFDHHYIQPMAGLPGSDAMAIDFCLKNPWWRLSLQTHKLVGIK